MKFFERANPSPRMRRFITWFNATITSIIHVPLFEKVLARRFAELTYIGPKSGKRYTFPVWAKPTKTGVEIPVYVPEQKNWWRLFRDPGMAIEIRQGQRVRNGWGVVTHEGRRVDLTVTWTDDSAADSHLPVANER